MALASAVNAAHALFRSKHAEAADTIRNKIGDAQTALATLQQQYPALAYEVGTDVEGAAERMAALQGEIGRATGDIELLKVALQQAEAKEQERITDAEKAAHRSKLRALSQHLASLRTAAAEYEMLVSRQVTAWDQMLAASDKIRKLVGGGAQVVSKQLHPTHLRALCEQELRRQAYADGHPSGIKFALPGASKPLVYKPDMPTLAAIVADLSTAAIQSEGGSGDE